MSGHSAIFGDQFSTVQAAKSSKEKGARAQYYPLSPPQNDIYNPTRPREYSPDTVTLRRQMDYMETLSKLSNARSKRELAEISRLTGVLVSRMPLAVASPAFTHPHFFPLDPFHLFYENCMPAMYDTWSTGSSAGEAVHISARKMQLLGELVAMANETLPPSFSGPIRDPYLKRQSQYKAYEWMALLHWYILPIGIEIGLSPLLLGNFAQFVHIVEFAMSIKPRSHADLCELQSVVWKFLRQYKQLYVGPNPDKIYRCRLCIFQLVHVPMHIKWFGSIRTCSQSTVERTIGEAGHKIHSKKEPFANFTSIVIEKEVIRLVELYYPMLRSQDPNASTSSTESGARESTLPPGGLDSNTHQYIVKLYGKVKLRNRKTLRSRISEAYSPTSRKYRWFESVPGVSSPHTSAHRFGEAVAFYTIEMPDGSLKQLAIYVPLVKIGQPYSTVIRGEWPQDSAEFVMELGSLFDIVGIWRRDGSQNVYVLRKHPAHLYLQLHELGVYGEGDEGDVNSPLDVDLD
ncbi:hypothetical protein BJ165DRAFT_1349037 [Panaeolus papilionaceus]|nr:hypothetical protein BJ165DRAFT_1349037 [Panaeolus papilionaceus]